MARHERGHTLLMEDSLSGLSRRWRGRDWESTLISLGTDGKG